jgi:hypothetical protein
MQSNGKVLGGGGMKVRTSVLCCNMNDKNRRRMLSNMIRQFKKVFGCRAIFNPSAQPWQLAKLIPLVSAFFHAHVLEYALIKGK